MCQKSRFGTSSFSCDDVLWLIEMSVVIISVSCLFVRPRSGSRGGLPARFFCKKSAFLTFLRRHPDVFLDVEGNGEETKVHIDLVFPLMAESLVLFVELHLPEDGFRLYRPLAPVLQSLLAEQLLPCPLLVFPQMVVHANDPVALFPLVTDAS